MHKQNPAPSNRRRWAIAFGVLGIVLVLLVIILLLKFGGESNSLVSPQRATTSTTVPTTQSRPTPSEPKPSTPGAATGVEVRDHSVQAGLIQREYLTATPTGIDPSKKLPVVLALHGLGVDRNGMLDAADWRGAVERDGFVAVFPQGWGNSWNMGPCCPPASLIAIDDVSFIDQVLAEVGNTYSVDPERVYVTGFSNGALMAYYLVCQRPDVFAGLAPIAGSNVSGCTPQKAVSLFHQHSDPDPVVPYDGPLGFGQLISSVPLPSVPDSVAAWAAADGCPAEPVESSEQSGIEHFRWDPCADGTKVELVRLPNLGHVWPNLGSYDGLHAMLSFFGLE